MKTGPSVVASVCSVVCEQMLVNARSAGAGSIERESPFFKIESIERDISFPQQGCATVAGIGDAGGSCPQAGIIDPGYTEVMNSIDESVCETE